MGGREIRGAECCMPLLERGQGEGVLKGPLLERAQGEGVFKGLRPIGTGERG